MKSKYPSKQPCLTCGSEWKVGDEITKIGDKYWCSNENCGGGAKTNKSPPNTNTTSGKENHGMFLTPIEMSAEEQVDVAAFNKYVKNVRLTCYELAKDLNPEGDDFSLRVGTAGLLHDAINHQSQSRQTRAILDNTLVLSEILLAIKELVNVQKLGT